MNMLHAGREMYHGSRPSMTATGHWPIGVRKIHRMAKPPPPRQVWLMNCDEL